MVKSFKVFDKLNYRAISDQAVFLFFVSCIALYAYLANKLRGGLEYGDETEKLVGALMVTKGGHLYRDVFAHHGPFSFMLAQASIAISGGPNITFYRIMPLIFSFFSIAAIFFSPALVTRHSRYIGAALLALAFSANQAIFGFMLGMYQVFAGYLLVCGMALFVLPVLFDAPIKRWAAFLGGLAIGFTFFAAYSFVITCACFFGACLYKACCSRSKEDANRAWQWCGYALLGTLTSGVSVLAWLLQYGDVQGYLIYHFYFNQFVYTKFAAFRPFEIFAYMVPVANYFYLVSHHSIPGVWVECVIFFCIPFYSILIGTYALKDKAFYVKYLPPFLLLCLGIVYTDPRGEVGFQSSTIAIASIGLMALTTAIVLDLKRPRKLPLLNLRMIAVIGAACVLSCFVAAQFWGKTYYSYLNPIEYYGNKGKLGLSNDPAMQFIRSFVGADETIEVLPWAPIYYINAGRVPASGHYNYLPWQNAYFKKPIWGYNIDICHDIEEKKPKAIFLDSQISIWGIDSSTYLGCIQEILKHKYFLTSQAKDVWVRADTAASRDDILQTAIIPSDFDIGWLSPDAQRRINAAKTQSKNPGTSTDN